MNHRDTHHVQRSKKSPYELALEFIRLSDIIRQLTNAGWPPSTSMQVELAEVRYELDLALAYQRPQINRNAEWDDRVRRMVMDLTRDKKVRSL